MATTSSRRERNILQDDEILLYLEVLLERCDESEGDISDGDDVSGNGNNSTIAALPPLQNINEDGYDSEESEEDSERIPPKNIPQFRKDKLMLREALLYSDTEEVTKIAEDSEQDEEKKPDLVRGGFQPRLPTSLPPPGQQQQQQPLPLPRRQPVPLMLPAQLHPGAPQVVAPAPAVPLQSPPPSELMDVDPSAGPPSQAVAVQPVLQPLSLGTPKESDTAAPCPAPTQQPSTQLY
ncbi:branchpoint-bridging protein-like [Schistocerca americana]|uniref:branchpoint-bridging protein-like n=1 Tax=Schistocerca americana TaxID=7009 RepID=UPI001F4FACB1|nr:branchpoint-bridging protein-like [Schistocerca americana]